MVVLRNCGESESDKAIEYSEELNGFYFPPSPTYFPPSPTTFPPSPSYFPLYSPPSPPPPSSSNSSVTYVWTGYRMFVPRNCLDGEIVDLAVVVEHEIQERDGALDVIPSGRLVKINELVQRLDDIVDSQARNTALEYVDEDFVEDFVDSVGFGQDVEMLKKQNEDIVGQLVVDSVLVKQYLIQYRDGALDNNQLGVFMRTNGSEISYGQLLTSTAETGLIFQTKLSLRVWQGHGGQWVADICYGWNWLNTGTLKTAEVSPFSSETVLRFRGGKDLFDHPFYELLVNENRAEPTTKPRTEIQMLELSPTEEQENPNEDFELGCSEATGNDGVEAEATENDGVEAVGIGGCNSCEGTPIEEVIQSTLEYACREYGIHIWSPHPNRTPMLVDQEEIPLLNSDLGNDKVDAAGIGGEGTKEGEIAEAQFNSGAFGNKKTTPVRNVIPLEKILQVKKMHLTDAAKHLKVRRSALKRACRVYGNNKWPPRNKHENIGQSPPNETPAVVEQEGIPRLTSDQASMSTVDSNIVAEETPPLQFSPTFQQENPDEDSNNDEVEQVGMGIVRTGKEIVLFKEIHLKDATRELKVDDEKGFPQLISDTLPSDQASAVTVDMNSIVVKVIQTLQFLPTTQQGNEDEVFGNDEVEEVQICPERTENDGICLKDAAKDLNVVDEEGSPQLINSDNLPSDQAAAVTVDTNSVVGKEIPPLQFSRTAQQKNSNEAFGNDEVEEGETESQFDSRCSAKRKRKEKNPRRERRNKKTTGVRIGTPLEDNLQTKGRSLKNDAKRLKGVRLENPDENSCNDEVEAVGMGGVGTGEGEVKEGELNCGSSDKGERNEKTPQGERASNKTIGVKIEIPLEEILKYKELCRKDAAMRLKVSVSTLKRVCREYKIPRWPPREVDKLIDQSRPSESPSVVDQEQIRQSNCDKELRSNQASIETNSVTVKAKYETVTIKFRLSRPLRKVELEENVKKRLGLKVGTYHTEYKDEDGELILISCDEDLKDCIPNSSPMGTCSIQLFLRQSGSRMSY